MNDRIRQLAVQSGMSKLVDSWEYERFAELIVKECLVVINQSNGVGDDDVIRISKDVEKHFGVEE